MRLEVTAAFEAVRERKHLKLFGSLSRLYRGNMRRSVQAKQAPFV